MRDSTQQSEPSKPASSNCTDEWSDPMRQARQKRMAMFIPEFAMIRGAVLSSQVGDYAVIERVLEAVKAIEDYVTEMNSRSQDSPYHTGDCE